MADDMIRALLEEREGYVRAGKTDRVAQVDEQLALRGYAAETRQKSGDNSPPKGRTARKRQTTEG